MAQPIFLSKLCNALRFAWKKQLLLSLKNCPKKTICAQAHCKIVKKCNIACAPLNVHMCFQIWGGDECILWLSFAQQKYERDPLERFKQSRLNRIQLFHNTRLEDKKTKDTSSVMTERCRIHVPPSKGNQRKKTKGRAGPVKCRLGLLRA
jgi:hypothetical protein